MALTHAHASGMGGMRAAGDLVARVQMARGMRIQEAKKYVADKLSISVTDLTDPVIMSEIRDDLQIGMVTPLPGCAKGIEAKHIRKAMKRSKAIEDQIKERHGSYYAGLSTDISRSQKEMSPYHFWNRYPYDDKRGYE